MFATLLRRTAQASRPAIVENGTAFRLKKVWPPDFSKLTTGEQLKFEKRYKRRVRVASSRPRWNKFIQLTQLFSVTFVTVYCVLFMDWKAQGEEQPFEGIRRQFWSLFEPPKGRPQLSTTPSQPSAPSR